MTSYISSVHSLLANYGLSGTSKNSTDIVLQIILFVNNLGYIIINKVRQIISTVGLPVWVNFQRGYHGADVIKEVCFGGPFTLLQAERISFSEKAVVLSRLRTNTEEHKKGQDLANIYNP